MRERRIASFTLLGLLVAGGGGGFLFTYLRQPPPQDRVFTITARQYAYDPSIIRVNRGDRVRIKLVAKDVTHGFYLEGYDLGAKARPENPTFWVRHPSHGADYKEAEEISFIANRAGKFHYRCSITCGYMHPFMNGVLIVRPNYLYSTSVGLALALVVGVLRSFRHTPAGEQR